MNDPATFLLVVARRGMVIDVSPHASIREAKKAFCEVARDAGYGPGEINESADYHVSIWEWGGEGYREVHPFS